MKFTISRFLNIRAISPGQDAARHVVPFLITPAHRCPIQYDGKDIHGVPCCGHTGSDDWTSAPVATLKHDDKIWMMPLVISNTEHGTRRIEEPFADGILFAHVPENS